MFYKIGIPVYDKFGLMFYKIGILVYDKFILMFYEIGYDYKYSYFSGVNFLL